MDDKLLRLKNSFRPIDTNISFIEMKFLNIGVFLTNLAFVSAFSSEMKDSIVDTVIENVCKTVKVATTVWATPPPPLYPLPTVASKSRPTAAYEASPATTFNVTTASQSLLPSSVAFVSSASVPFSSSSAISDDLCGNIGGTCSGDITVYDTTAGLTPELFKVSGFGACGWLNNGTTEDVFALAHGECHNPMRFQYCPLLNQSPRHDGIPIQR